MFQRFDRDRDGALNDEELQRVFEASPRIPLPDNLTEVVATNPAGNITLSGWIAAWRYAYALLFVNLSYEALNGQHARIL